MTESNGEQEVQDPAEPMKVDQVVETHTAGEEPSDAQPQQTTVETTVEQPSQGDSGE